MFKSKFKDLIIAAFDTNSTVTFMFHMVSLVSFSKPIVNNPIQYDGIVSSSYFISAISHSFQGGDQIKLVIMDMLVTG